jgi:DNA-binding beta-propeller fold protein YncE
MRRTQDCSERWLSLRVLLCVVALGVGVSLSWTPQFPDTIQLPDSLGPLRPGYHLAFGSSTSDIYVASESSDIIVVDGSSAGDFRRIKRISTGTPVGAALLVSQHNRLYCTYPSQGRIGVIDGATNDTVGSIQVSARPKLLCYSSGSDRLYCGDSVNRKVWVIDCAADTVRNVITTASNPVDLIYDPTTNKVYVQSRYSVQAISCATDSVVSSIAGDYWSGLCLNRRRQKLYVVGRLTPETLYVISTQCDSVTAKIPTGTTGELLLVCNETTDRLYRSAYGSEVVKEYDCLGDTVIRGKYLAGCEARAIACDTVYNRLLFRSTYRLLALDCATFDIIAYLAAPDYDGHSDPLGWDQARYRAMCAVWVGGEEWGALYVNDCKSDTPYYRGTVPLSGWAHSMSHNPATSKLYCSLGGEVAVIDERTNRQVGRARGIGGSMAYSRTSNKFYFPSSVGLGVMDGAGDSLLRYIDISDSRWDPFPCWCPEGNKVYFFADKGARLFMVAVDCSTDSVVWERDMYDLGRWFEHLDNGLMLVNHSDSLALFDPRTDSVLAESSLAAGGVYAVTHTGNGEKFYIVRRYPGRLEVRSSSTLKLLSTIEWSYFDWSMTFLAYSDTTQKLYWFVDDSVLAIDAARDTVTARMTTDVCYEGACFDHTGRYLYCAPHFDSTLRVYDTELDSLVAMYPGQPPSANNIPIAPSPEQGLIYVGYPDVILVYPDAPPGIEEAMNGDHGVVSALPTVVRDVLLLPEAANHTPQAASLLGVSGRKVMGLQSGANHVRDLPPGVYFVHTREPRRTRKIIILQ